jgi:hypothetical protein
MAQRSRDSPHERFASASLLAPGFDEKIAAVVFLDAASPDAAHQSDQDFYEAELMRSYGTRKIFLVYGSLTADPGAKPLTST